LTTRDKFPIFFLEIITISQEQASSNRFDGMPILEAREKRYAMAFRLNSGALLGGIAFASGRCIARLELAMATAVIRTNPQQRRPLMLMLPKRLPKSTRLRSHRPMPFSK
jgi:hypothetical protein